MQLAFRAQDGTTYFEHQDWLNTTRMRTDYEGNVAGTFTSLPFGDGSSSTLNKAAAGQDNTHFADLDLDNETNTDHATFRQYGNIQGRWMSPDPYYGSYNPNNPQSMNRYNYVENNPLVYVDPDGTSPCENGDPDCVPAPPLPPVTVNAPDPCDGYTCFGGPGDGPTGGPSGQQSGSPGTGPNKPVVLQNPCPYQGRALPPSAYAAQGQAAKGSSVNFALDVTTGFPGGDYLDPQPLGSGNAFQNQAYGNYTFGVYMQSAGLTLPQALSGANDYAAIRKAFNRLQYTNQTMDPNYPSLPAASVANITNGFNAQASGTTCHN